MRGLEADDDIAGLLPSLDVPVCLDNLLQGRGSVDDSLELSGPEQLGQLPHRLLVVVRNGEQDLLAARQGGNEGQERILGQRTNSGAVTDDIEALLLRGEVHGRVVDDSFGSQPRFADVVLAALLARPVIPRPPAGGQQVKAG